MDADRSSLLTASFVRVWLATLGAFASFGMVVFTLPLYTKDELGRGSVGIGVAVGAASLTSMISSILSGRYADRRGRRPLLLAGAAVMFACYLALALTPGLVGVIGIRLVAGAAEAAFVVGAYTVIADIAPEAWPLERDAYLLETSVPGIFAAGDVRSGSVKRCATAVGEGAMVVRFVHEHLSVIPA